MATIRITTLASALAYLATRNHEGEVVEHNGETKIKLVCSRCGGTGYWSRNHWNRGGVCFKCEGSGGILYADPIGFARKVRRRHRAHERRTEEKRARREAYLNEQRDENEANGWGRVTNVERGEIKLAKIKADRAAADAKSEYFGEVGDRLTIEVKVEKILRFVNHYGYNARTTFLHLMTSGDNRVVWFCNGSPLDEGSTAIVKATVKKHDTRDGVKQTVVTRVAEVAAA
jgi:hypothetical protein